jgi:hypothetical protein
LEKVSPSHHILSGKKCEIAIFREGAPTSSWFKEENPNFFYFPLYLSPNLAKSSCEDRQLTYFTNLREKTLSVEYKRNMVYIYNFTLPGKIRTKVLPPSTLAGAKGTSTCASDNEQKCMSFKIRQTL